MACALTKWLLGTVTGLSSLMLIGPTGAAAQSMPAPTAGAYKITGTVKLGGEGSWDYLQYDAVRRRLYIARVGGVQVLAGDALEPVGSIPAIAGTRVHGVALAEPLNLGITGNGADKTATVFDLETLAVVRTVRLPHAPDAVAWDPFSGGAVMVAEDAPALTVFDPKTGKVLADVKLPGSPEAVASDGKGKLYVTLSDTSEIALVDTRTWQLADHWAVGAGCEEPTPISLDAEGHRLFVGCRNRIMPVIDVETRRLLASPVLCNGVDALVYDPSSEAALASCNEGVLDVFDARARQSYPLLQAVATAPGARTMALDSTRQQIYLPAADKGPLLPKTEDVPARPAIVPETFRVLTVGK